MERGIELLRKLVSEHPNIRNSDQCRVDNLAKHDCVCACSYLEVWVG